MSRQITLPPWCESLRPHQADAVAEIVAAYRDGVDLVLLDAPTGSGKTLIAEVVRQMMGFPKTSYVCSSLTLQDQFEEDFEYAKVAKGRSNYSVRGGRTAADCVGSGCELCPSLDTCPYQVAKEEAREAELACMNTTFTLYQSNMGKWHRDFMVLDECDVLESELLAYDTIRIPDKWIRAIGESPPKKGAHGSTIRNWLGMFESRGKSLMSKLDKDEQRTLSGLLGVIKRMKGEEWVRVYERHAGLVLKPVWAHKRASDHLWAHANRWLLMSGSVVDGEALLRDLGYQGSWRVVRVPMTFPVANRPIFFPTADAVDMSYKNRTRAWPEMANQIETLINERPDLKYLVHCVSYPLTDHLHSNVSVQIPMYTYKNSRERAAALEEFKYSDAGVMFAPSFDRGVDLPDVDVVVIAKVPYPNLKDPVVSQKLHDGPEGQLWYSTQTVRTVLQMTGRHVRSKDDVGATVILDQNFRRLMKQNRRMFPDWWRDALSHGKLEI